jgi:hypothetical protein
MLPNSKIVIEKNGNSRILGLEETADCGRLSELGKAAGKVTKDEDEDHAPVFQDVHTKK